MLRPVQARESVTFYGLRSHNVDTLLYWQVELSQTSPSSLDILHSLQKLQLHRFSKPVFEQSHQFWIYVALILDIMTMINGVPSIHSDASFDFNPFMSLAGFTVVIIASFSTRSSSQSFVISQADGKMAFIIYLCYISSSPMNEFSAFL